MHAASRADWSAGRRTPRPDLTSRAHTSETRPYVFSSEHTAEPESARHCLHVHVLHAVSYHERPRADPERYGTEQLVWARQGSHLLFLIALFAPSLGIGLVRTRQAKWQILRSVVLMVSTLCFFNGVKHLPLAKAASISFMGPFFVTLMAWPMLGERISVPRLMAILFGFLGVLVIIRPGSGVFQWASLLILASALCYAFYQILTRFVGNHDKPETSAVYSALVGTVALSFYVPFAKNAEREHQCEVQPGLHRRATAIACLAATPRVPA